MSNDLAISDDAYSPPPITVIPENQLAEQIQHAQSDCGHYYGSPQLKRSHSLLRNFSLRSRNTLRKANRVHCLPPPSTSRPANVRTNSASSDTNSLSSTWKKLRVKCANLTALAGQDGELNIVPAHHDTLSQCPRGSARKRSLFSPIPSVRRLVFPFQIPRSSSSSSSSDDSPCVPVPPLPSTSVKLCLDAIQDEDDNIVSNSSRDVGIVENGWVDLMAPVAAPPFSSSSLPTPSFPPLPLPTPSSSSSPQLPSSPSTSPPLPAQLISSSSSSSPNVNTGLISPNRRAKFTLDHESDLDCDPLAVSVSAVVEAGSTVSSSNVGSVVLPNDSAQTSAPIAIRCHPLTRHEGFDCESRDQVGTSTSAPGTTSMASEKSLRRWTLSSALTDEDISDEGLVEELERMRKVLEWDCTPIDRDDTSSLFPSPPTASNRWMITQRALLTTRELILTERHYLSSLLLLLCPGSTLTPVPEMMVSYVKELVSVSERLLKGMEEEPSVRGVAEVFVEVGGGPDVDGAESAFSEWCGVVGRWFQGDLADPRAGYVKRKRKRFTSSVGGGEEHSSGHEGSGPGLGVTPSTGEHAHTSPLMRNVSTWRKSMPSIAGLGESGAWRKDNKDRDKDEGYGRGRISPTFEPVPTSSLSANISKPIRKPAVRDLAILPTQRVMRYVLLYRDLLANTSPSSSSFPIVERAVEAACRIAEKCDRAQCNAAFVAGGSTPDSSTSRSSSTSVVNNGSGSSRSQRFHGNRVMTMPEPSLKLKTGWGSTAQSSPESPTKSHFILSSSPVSTSPSTSSALQRSSSSKSIPSSLPLQASPNKLKKRSVTNPLPPPLPSLPPSSFNPKIPMPRSGLSSGSLSTSSAGSSSATTTSPGDTYLSSSPSASSSFSSSSPSSPLSFLTKPSSPLCLPKSAASSNIFSRKPRPLSTV